MTNVQKAVSREKNYVHDSKFCPKVDLRLYIDSAKKGLLQSSLQIFWRGVDSTPPVLLETKYPGPSRVNYLPQGWRVSLINFVVHAWV